MLFFVMHMFFCLSPLLNTYHVGRVIEGYEKQNNIGVFLNKWNFKLHFFATVRALPVGPIVALG